MSLRELEQAGVTHALSVRNPWAWAIFHAGKDVENRTVEPPRNFVGRRIAIHVGTTFGKEERAELALLQDVGMVPRSLAEADLRAMSGRIVGHVLLDGAIDDSHELAFESGWYGGPHGWILLDRILLAEPVPARGMLGLWPIARRVTTR